MSSPGFVLWFTGLSGAGKSTLASLVAAELLARGVHVEVLDGDEVRTHLSKGLGFSREDRDTNVRRIGFVAKLVARAGACAMTAAISPYRATRDEQRQKIGRFVEVYLKCPVPILSDRDPKGLYKKALAGEIQHFTGIDDPYEPPLSPEVELDTSELSPRECVERIIATLERLRYLGERAAEVRGRPYGEPPHIRGADESAGLRAVETEGADTLRWIASGLFAPLHGPLGSKDLTRIRKDGRLERGLRFDCDASVVIAERGAIVPGTRVALVDRASTSVLATLVAEETFVANDGELRIAGPIDASPLAEVGRAARARAEIAQRGGSVAGMFVDRPAHRGDAYLARVALESHDALVALVAGDASIAQTTRALFEAELPRARLVFVEMPPLPAPGEAPIARAVALKNLGVTHVVAREDDAPLSRAVTEAAAELALTVSPAVATFVAASGALCSERTLPSASDVPPVRIGSTAR